MALKCYRFQQFQEVALSLFVTGLIADCDLRAAEEPPRASISVSASPEGAHTVPPTDTIVAVSPDAKHRLMGGNDGRLRLISSTNGKVSRTLYHCSPRAAVFSTDGTQIASLGRSKSVGGDTIRIWRVADGALLQTVTNLRGAMLSLAVSPNNMLLAANSGSTLNCWRIADSALLWTSPAENISSVSFSSDGYVVIAGLRNGTSALFHAIDGKPLLIASGRQ